MKENMNESIYDGILHLVYWENPMYRIEIQKSGTIGDNSEELIVECSFFHSYFDREMHFRFSLASGNVYYKNDNRDWEMQKPDYMKVKQVFNCDRNYFLVCEGILTIDITPHLTNLDRSKHFIRADDQRLNVFIDKKTGLDEAISRLNSLFWNLEIE